MQERNKISFFFVPCLLFCLLERKRVVSQEILR